MNKQPVNPLVHLNGTGRKTLVDCYDKADDAFFDFIKAWQEIEFNARDYYPLGMDAWSQALEEREALNRSLRTVQDYITRIRSHLYETDRSR